MLALVARILVSSNVVPGPTVEASVLNVGNVIGREIIAEFVALINGGPEFAGLWVDGNTYCIADTPRVNTQPGAIGVRLQDVRPVKFNGIVVGIVDVRLRSDRYVHLLPIQRKHNVARPVSPSAQQPAAREIGHNHFSRTAGCCAEGDTGRATLCCLWLGRICTCGEDRRRTWSITTSIQYY